MFTVVKCTYEKPDGTRFDGWILANDKLYPYWPNKFLHQMAVSSSGTARQYAYKLCKFLNYLEEVRHVTYEEATKEDLEMFITYLRHLDKNGNFIYDKSFKSGFTIKNYYGVIRSFYVYLYSRNEQIKIELKKKTTHESKYSYLYGQSWDKEYSKYVIEGSDIRDKDPVEYEKWYTDDEKEAILESLNTVRDKAIFSMTLDGMRIDEVLSSKLSLYDDNGGFIEAYRSKRRTTGDTDRLVSLSERSIKYLEDYLYGERSLIEDDLIENNINPPDFIFLNEKKNTKSYGKPVQYANFLKILKRAAHRCGLDPDKIRTHSGRSTKAGELFRQQATAQTPDEALTDNQILTIMGWSNISSGEPYKNRLDKETAKSNRKRMDKVMDSIEKKSGENK